MRNCKFCGERVTNTHASSTKHICGNCYLKMKREERERKGLP